MNTAQVFLNRCAAVFAPFPACLQLSLLLTIGSAAVLHASEAPPAELRWPVASRENRPWTRWWWMGSAVDETNLTRQLTQFRDAGLGGVEICPIYGAKGYEPRFIDYLSPRWMKMLAHAAGEAKRLDLGLDFTTGTGWPFGGPNVTPETASTRVNLKRYELAGGAHFESELPQGQIECITAVPDQGASTNLTALVKQRRLDWTAPPGVWRLYALVRNSPVQKVKRPAPGGEGNVVDPFSTKALDHYLERFDRAFADYHGQTPRSQFHDSFEYYGAQWSPAFLKEFQARRGYDLREQLPAFFGDGPSEVAARVQCDYRETISDLHLAYIRRWTEWAHAHHSLSRDQAHGSPGNLVDLYAASDIPETEIFGSVEEVHIPMNKFSSSAAHLAGRRLASSESFTWLTDHFQASLAQVKPAADYLFLSGVNHIFFHGIPYSPADAAWPGWQFYAAVNFGPQGGLWHDLPEFNAYVSRCQSILQSGSPDNDLLVYYPVYDVWSSTGELIRPNPVPKSFTNSVMTLWQRGYSFDYVSDRFLARARCAKGRVLIGSAAYRAVVVPECRVMPEATLKHLARLARNGAKILFEKAPPSEVPGFARLPARSKEFQRALADFTPSVGTPENEPVPLGKGSFQVGPDLAKLLDRSRLPRESAADLGLRFVRRAHPKGYHYFLVNRGEKAIDGWVPLGTPAKSAVILDPRFPDRAGVAPLRRSADSSSAKDSVYLQLQPGESCFVRTFTNHVVTGPQWQYVEPVGTAQAIAGTWKVDFIEGGPELPAAFQTAQLDSWTRSGDSETKRFAGTARYTIEFETPGARADDWLLDLGRVCESARVRLNGHQLGALWCAPFRESIGPWLRPGKNLLQVDVTNLAANRIADLDRRKVDWKYFYDINVVNRRYRPFDASDWPPFDSGLLGPVTLVPLKRMAP